MEHFESEGIFPTVHCRKALNVQLKSLNLNLHLRRNHWNTKSSDCLFRDDIFQSTYGYIAQCYKQSNLKYSRQKQRVHI